MQDGMTAIHLAARYGHMQVLDALKEHVSAKVTSTKVCRYRKLLEFIDEM